MGGDDVVADIVVSGTVQIPKAFRDHLGHWNPEERLEARDFLVVVDAECRVSRDGGIREIQAIGVGLARRYGNRSRWKAPRVRDGVRLVVDGLVRVAGDQVRTSPTDAIGLPPVLEEVPMGATRGVAAVNVGVVDELVAIAAR